MTTKTKPGEADDSSAQRRLEVAGCHDFSWHIAQPKTTEPLIQAIETWIENFMP